MTEETNNQQDTVDTNNNNKDTTPETSAPDTTEKPKLNLEQGIPDNIQYPLAAKIKNDAKYTNRNNDSSIVNKNNHLSFAIRDGFMSLAANKLSSFKLDGRMGATQSTGREHEIKTNRIKYYFDDMLFNGHKFNPVFYEYANYKQYKDQNNNIHTVGHLCVSGSVMVRAWDEQLGRNVLIRRPARFPMFAPLNNVPVIDPALHIFDPSEYKELFDTTQDQSTSAEGWFNAVSAKFQQQQAESAESAKNAEGTEGTDGTGSSQDASSGDSADSQDDSSESDGSRRGSSPINKAATIVGEQWSAFVDGWPDKVYTSTSEISKDRSTSLKRLDKLYDTKMEKYKETYKKNVEANKDNKEKQEEFKKQYEQEKKVLKQEFSEVKAAIKNYYAKRKEEVETKLKQEKEEKKQQKNK